MESLAYENPSEPNDEIQVLKTPTVDYESVAKKKRYIYSDLERQLFNLDLSMSVFRRKAREMEKKSLESKRKCRQLLRLLRSKEAWIFAKKGLEAQRNALLFNIASRRLKMIVRMVRSTDELEPLLKAVLRQLDIAVQGGDVDQIKLLLNRLEEEYDMGYNETLKFSDEKPTDEEVTEFIIRLQEEIQILQRLKADNGSSDLYIPQSASSIFSGRKACSNSGTLSRNSEQIFSSKDSFGKQRKAK